MRPIQYLSARPKLVRGLKLGAAIVGGLAVAGLLTTLGLLWYLPLTADFRDPSRLALTIQDRDGQAIAYRGVSPGGSLPLSSMPEHLPNAFIAFEDRRFRDHPGIDLFGIVRAAAVNASAGSWRQGASTITQQLVKNTYLTPEKTLTRKVQEAALAVWLERRLTKDAIIERYLNTVYLGAGAYGVDAASRRYFGKSASEATLSEAAMLAGLAQAPSRTAPTVALKTAQERASLVLDTMVDVGSITPEQAAAAKAQPATLAAQPTSSIAAAYPADWAASNVRSDLGDLSGSLTVRTTIDPGLQELATRTLQAVLSKEGPDANATQGALVAMQPDGRILAVVGGVDYAASEYNRAVQARRQPGSLFKLFVYLAALQSGVQPGDRVEDQPVTIDGWSPGNYSNTFHGTVTVREAFSRSYNAASVRLQERVGRDKVIELAKSMGISGSLPPHPSLVLGTTEVSLVEITAAFAAVQAGKVRVRPRVIESLTTPAGVPLAAPVDNIPDAQWPRAAMLDLLRAVVDGGTGGAARLPVQAYGKTGTTQDNRDAWFVGFAGDLVVGVWIGNDDDRPMNKVTGGGLPARLWQAFMIEALKGAPAYSTTPVAALQPGADAPIEGQASVVDTGTLRVDGQQVRLLGVVGKSGAPAQAMADYIGDRDVQCRASANGQHRCEVDGWDLSEVVLFNGGGRASPDAPAGYVRAERKARSERKGIWAEGG
jgi:penicillin-binding protein 1A